VSLLEKDFVIGLRNGNASVYEAIFKSYYERLCNYANTMTNDMDEAEEIVQNTFLTLWEKHDTIEIHTSVKSYLYRAVHNHCLNRVKHLIVRKEHSDDYKYHADLGSDNVLPELLGNELEQQVNMAIEALPPQCGTVFKLSRFENLSYAEIADQLNVSVKTVDNHMGKALKLMREKLKEYLPLLVWIAFLMYVLKE
jgi:RNA polymerase sigma-70 factor (family 1)